MFLNKVIAVEPVYEKKPWPRLSSALLTKFRNPGQRFLWFVISIKALPDQAKHELLKYPLKEKSANTFLNLITHYSKVINDPVVCQKLLCLYQELTPLGKEAVTQRSVVLIPSDANSEYKNFVKFVSKLYIKKPALGKDPIAALLECSMKQDFNKFEKLLKIYSKLLYPTVSKMLLHLFSKVLLTTEFNPNEIGGTSTPVNTFERRHQQVSIPVSALIPVDIRQLTREVKKEIRAMFASPDKADKRQPILDKLRKNENGQAIKEHLLKNNWLFFLGHSKFKADLKSLDFSRKSSVLDTSAAQY